MNELLARSDILIRPASAADIAAITRIYAHAVEHGTASFETEPPAEAEMARRQQVLLAGGFPYLIAEIAGGVAGYAYAGPIAIAGPTIGASRIRFM
jgi:L-amino acid N-acyltransferase YncA